jgi:NTE family protein
MENINKNINNLIENEINELCNKNKSNKNTIVFAGGGVKGFVFIGVIKYLEEINIMKYIDTFIGTSIGAYFSILYVIGYNSRELYQIVKNFDFSKSSSLNFKNILENFSFDDSQNFNIIFKKLLNAKHIDENITLLELYKKTKKKIILTTVCLTDKKIEYISYENYPDLSLLIGLRMTTCIPLLFPPVKYNNKLYIDGGVLDNFPIDIVNYKLNEVIGINIIADLKNTKEYENIIDYISDIFNLFFNNISNKYEDIKYKNIIYNIPLSKNNPINLNLSLNEKKELINFGYDFMKKNFNQNLIPNHE